MSLRNVSARETNALSQWPGGRNAAASSAVTHLCSECSSLMESPDASGTEHPKLTPTISLSGVDSPR